MKAALRISLKTGERIYVNGAVLRVDRKVTLEFLNNVTFLLEQHIIKQEETTTPLRQLYYMIQLALMEPGGSAQAEDMALRSIELLRAAFSSATVQGGLDEVAGALGRHRYLDALKLVRNLFPVEAAILADGANIGQAREKVAACK